jgi:predicted amidohydrolase
MRIAVAQTPGTQLERWPQTLAMIEEMIARAAELRAELVVLPECVWPAYHLGSRSAYFAARRAGLPDQHCFLKQLSSSARAGRIAVCAGYVEETNNRLANAACLIDAHGALLGVHRKCFLWDFDHDWFEPGSAIQPVQATFGRVGLMICADARLPEIPATLGAAGANLILHPTAWVNAGGRAQPWNPQPDFLIAARAREFGVPIASASKWGVEGNTTFVGSSLICDGGGSVLVRCGQRETTLVAAEVEVTAGRPPAVTDAERVTLLSPKEPVLPRADVGPLGVLPLPPNADLDQIACNLRAKPFGDRALLALGYRAESVRPGRASPFVADPLAVLGGPSADSFEIAAVRIAAIRAADAGRFAAIRRLALEGVHLVVVFGAGVSPELLRARACENRIFVLEVAEPYWRVLDPSGREAHGALWPPHVPEVATTLDVAQAADKNVARATNVVSGRRPAQYEF